MDYSQLKERLDQKYPTLDDEAANAALNTKTILTRKLVDKVTALNYLLGHGIWDKLDLAQMNPQYPDQLRVRIRSFMTTMTTYEQTNQANFEADAPNLVAIRILDQSEVDGFLELSEDYISDVEELFGRGVTSSVSDVTRARNVENYEAWQALQGRIIRAYNQAVEQTHDPDLSVAPPSWDAVIEQMRGVE